MTPTCFGGPTGGPADTAASLHPVSMQVKAMNIAVFREVANMNCWRDIDFLCLNPALVVPGEKHLVSGRGS
jgi:hypothetical protein